MVAPGAPQTPTFSLEQLSAAELALWHRLREWVQTETGMNFDGARESRLLDAVRKVLLQPISLFAELETLLNDPQQRCRFLERISSELTVGESFFFRNEHHFQALREHVLPEILRQNAAQREIRIWSAGCAGGEEPYSLAILLAQLLGEQLESWRVSILATDLNPEFLQRARLGVFRSWSFRRTKIHDDRHCFVQEPDCFRLVPRIRSLVRFSYLNLVKDVYPSAMTGTLGLDLILFRNVAIYLRGDVTAAIIARFQRALRSGGWLLLGESEVNGAATEGFRPVRFGQATFHRRLDADLKPSCTFGQPLPPVLARLGVATQAPPPPDRTPLLLRGGDTLQHRSAPVPRAELQPQQTPQHGITLRSHEGLQPSAEQSSEHPNRAQTRLAHCKALLSSAQIAQAREVLALCLKEDPLLLEAQLLAAALAEEAGETEAAEQAYRRAIYIERNCAMSHFQLGLILARQGKHELARKSLEVAAALCEGQPPDACVQYGEGVCYGRLRELIALLITR